MIKSTVFHVQMKVPVHGMQHFYQEAVVLCDTMMVCDFFCLQHLFLVTNAVELCNVFSDTVEDCTWKTVL